MDADGEIDRSKLGEIVFADPPSLRQLEAITHPAVRVRIDALARAAESDVVVIEAIKLLEGALREAVDAVWVMDAPPTNQLARLTKQRGMTKAAAQQRIAAQNSQADKLAAADVIIRNAGSLAEVRAQIQRAWQRTIA